MDTPNEIIVLGRYKYNERESKNALVLQQGTVFSIEGVSPGLMSRDYKDPLKILVVEDHG